MPRDASKLARRLARAAEAVCRHYLSKGRRQGRSWPVGDVRNTPGRSMFVRLSGPDSGPGAAGLWTDAALAEHGDLLDVIRESCGLVEFREVAEEARRFLALPRAEPRAAPRPPALQGSPEAARRLWDGTMTGAHRTWLDPGSACKAPVSTPRRAMGLLLGNAVVRPHDRRHDRRRRAGNDPLAS